MPTEIFRNICRRQRPHARGRLGGGREVGPRRGHPQHADGHAHLRLGRRRHAVRRPAAAPDDRPRHRQQAEDHLPRRGDQRPRQPHPGRSSRRAWTGWRRRASSSRTASARSSTPTSICYLEAGQIVEQGTYQELMEKDGALRRPRQAADGIASRDAPLLHDGRPARLPRTPVSQRRRRPRPAGAGAGRGAARQRLARVRRARPRRRRVRGARRGVPAAPASRSRRASPRSRPTAAATRRGKIEEADAFSPGLLLERPESLLLTFSDGVAGLLPLLIAGTAPTSNRSSRVHRAQRAARRAGSDGRLLRQGPEQTWIA